MELPPVIQRQLMEEREVVMSSDSGESAVNIAWRKIDFLLDQVLELDRLAEVL